MNNAEKIGELDTYKLAEFLYNFSPCIYCVHQEYMCPRQGQDCLGGIRAWLEKEDSGE